MGTYGDSMHAGSPYHKQHVPCVTCRAFTSDSGHPWSRHMRQRCCPTRPPFPLQLSYADTGGQ
eukprot:3660007-Pyramimonas_sp.AAC.1